MVELLMDDENFIVSSSCLKTLENYFKYSDQTDFLARYKLRKNCVRLVVNLIVDELSSLTNWYIHCSKQNIGKYLNINLQESWLLLPKNFS